MTSALDTAVEMLTELEAEVRKITHDLPLRHDKILEVGGDVTCDTWLLRQLLGDVARYFDEADVEVRRSRIEAKIDQLVDLYKRYGCSGLLQLEATPTFETLRQTASANLSKHGIDPTRGLRVVVLDLAANRPPTDQREYEIGQWARTLVGERSDWMVFAYLDGIKFQEDFKHNEYCFSSSSRALEPSEEGDYPRAEPHTSVHLTVRKTPPPVYPASSASEIYRKLYQLTVCLQLYTGRAVRLLMSHLRPYGTRSRDHLFRHWVLEENPFVQCRSVAPEEFASVGRMFDRLLPALEALGVQSDTYGEDYRVIAAKHYSDSLLRSDRLEKVASAVMSLEAVYSLEGTDLQYRLRQRIERLTRPILDDYDSISYVLREAYAARSGYFHGEKPGMPKQKDIDLLLKISRISIQLALLLNMNKKDFISMLDRAMVDDERARELVEKVLQEYGTIQ